MSSCKYVKEKFMEFIDDELSIDETNKILEHLACCKVCKLKYEKQITLKNLIRKNLEKTPPSFSFNLNKNIYKCYEVGNKIVEFEDGGLSPKERKEVSAHLLECAFCREEYEKVKAFNLKVRTSLTNTPFESTVNIKDIVTSALCENKKYTIAFSSVIASCVMIASLVSVSSIDNKQFMEVSFKKEEVMQEKPEQIVLKDITEETNKDSQKLIYEIK